MTTIPTPALTIDRLNAACRALLDRGRDRHVELLRRALQLAVSIEFCTIPPYLCALWSIKDELDRDAVSIRQVVQEEMLHLALACNMLVAIGGAPRIGGRWAPRYPTKLPAGLHPHLTVGLSGLTAKALEAFMTIEAPDSPNAETSRLMSIRYRPPKGTTIGEYYRNLLTMFECLLTGYGLVLSPDRQLTGPLSWIVVGGLDDVKEAIGLIENQGEGRNELPLAGTYDEDSVDFAHYWRFEQVYRQADLRFDKRRKEWSYRKRAGRTGLPECWPMAPVPAGGYLKRNVSAEVWRLLDGFDELYTEVLGDLEAAWSDGGQASLLRAVEKMFALQNLAIPLMQIPIPGRRGATYGPCFRVKRRGARPA